MTGFLIVGYSCLDTVIQRSFSTDAQPVLNTSSNFSRVHIGQFSPLVGARPSCRAPHSGYFGMNYARSKFYGSLTGTLVGRRADSHVLYDASIGNGLLLPNRNLLGAYQRLELGVGFQITHLGDDPELERAGWEPHTPLQSSVSYETYTPGAKR